MRREVKPDRPAAALQRASRWQPPIIATAAKARRLFTRSGYSSPAMIFCAPVPRQSTSP